MAIVKTVDGEIHKGNKIRLEKTGYLPEETVEFVVLDGVYYPIGNILCYHH